jgi:chitodextrinase
VERCQGDGCTTFAQIFALTGTTFNNTGLTASTSYSYRVLAVGRRRKPQRVLERRFRDHACGAGHHGTERATGLSAKVSGSAQVDLAWTASTDNVGVTGYQILRCTGSTCTTFAQVGTSTVTSFSNTGLTASTTYRYRVRAVDAAGNVSGNSNTVNATTTAAPDTTPPSAPGGLAAVAASQSQISVSWTAATDNVGVIGYQLERCSGSGCSAFAQIAAPTATSFNDSGLTASTSYSYRARAVDAAGNLGGYSSGRFGHDPGAGYHCAQHARRVDGDRGEREPGQPGWTASTDNVAVTGYILQRCQGAGCSTWTTIATPDGHDLQRHRADGHDHVPLLGTRDGCRPAT